MRLKNLQIACRSCVPLSADDHVMKSLGKVAASIVTAIEYADEALPLQQWHARDVMIVVRLPWKNGCVGVL